MTFWEITLTGSFGKKETQNDFSKFPNKSISFKFSALV